MKKICSKKYLIPIIILFIMIFAATSVYAAPAASNTAASTQGFSIPNINLNINGSSGSTPKAYVNNIKLLIVLTILTLLPSIAIMMTSFLRIVVVFSLLKSALGAQQSIPNQVLIGLAIFMTVFIMMPTINTINKNAVQPYLNNTITQDKAIEEVSKPLRVFMLKQTYTKDLKLFMDSAKLDKSITKDNVPLYVVIPAFMISELKTAFMIGFLLYIPFLIIDIVVSSVLMSMGMFMLPPAMISLPFKLLLFVMVDGWYLLVKSLITSFAR